MCTGGDFHVEPAGEHFGYGVYSPSFRVRYRNKTTTVTGISIRRTKVVISGWRVVWGINTQTEREFELSWDEFAEVEGIPEDEHWYIDYARADVERRCKQFDRDNPQIRNYDLRGELI